MSILAGVAKLPGVLATAVFSDSGQILAADVQPPYEEVLLAHVLSLLRNSFDIFTASAGDPDAGIDFFIAHLEAGAVLLRRRDGKTVMVVADENANHAAVGVALNVVMVKLSRLEAPPPAVQSSGTQRAVQNSPPSFTPPASMTPATSFTPVEPHEVAEPLGDPVGMARVRQLLELFKSAVGPAAKTVLKSTMGQLGYRPKTLTYDQYPHLIAALSRKIHNAEWRAKFVHDAEKLL